MPLFVILFKIFVKPLITACQIRYLCKICHCPKNRQLSTCPFLSSHLNIWPNPWWFFWHTRHICRNLPFLNIPLFVTSNEGLPDRWWILAQFPIFSNLPFLCRSPTVNMPVLLFHCLSPCQIRRFCKICHFRKTHNYWHASFVILF